MTEPLRKSTSTPTSSREGKSTGDDAAGARTAEASTHTAMSLKLPLLVIASCIFVGNGVSYCLYLLISSLLTSWQLDFFVSRIGATRIGAVGCAVTFYFFGSKMFDLGVGIYLVGLRVSGLLDHRSALLLAATNPIGDYRWSLTGGLHHPDMPNAATLAAFQWPWILAAKKIAAAKPSLTGRRYRVMGEENAQSYAQNYAEDKTACGDRLARWWWVHCALGSLIGIYFSVVGFVSQPPNDSLQWQNGTDV